MRTRLAAVALAAFGRIHAVEAHPQLAILGIHQLEAVAVGSVGKAVLVTAERFVLCFFRRGLLLGLSLDVLFTRVLFRRLRLFRLGRHCRALRLGLIIAPVAQVACNDKQEAESEYLEAEAGRTAAFLAGGGLLSLGRHGGSDWVQERGLAAQRSFSSAALMPGTLRPTSSRRRRTGP